MLTPCGSNRPPFIGRYVTVVSTLPDNFGDDVAGVTTPSFCELHPMTRSALRAHPNAIRFISYLFGKLQVESNVVCTTEDTQTVQIRPNRIRLLQLLRTISDNASTTSRSSNPPYARPRNRSIMSFPARYTKGRTAHGDTAFHNKKRYYLQCATTNFTTPYRIPIRTSRK